MSDEIVSAVRATVDERERVLEIVHRQLGFAAICSDTPGDISIEWFRDLWESINREVRGA